jgi:hypothetical protein
MSRPEEQRRDDAEINPDPLSGAPRWVTPVGIVVGLVVVGLLVVLHLTGVLGPGAH